MLEKKAIPLYRDIVVKCDDYYDVCKVWYEEEMGFDEFGNYISQRNAYAIKKELVGFYIPKLKGIVDITDERELLKFLKNTYENGNEQLKKFKFYVV